MQKIKCMKIANNILETIGNTPMVKLNAITKEMEATVLAKVEYFNPGSSVKDRICLLYTSPSPRDDL